MAQINRRLRRNGIIIALLSTLLVSGYGLFHWLFGDLPSPEALPARLHQPSIRITDRRGQLLYEVLPEEGGRHTVLPFSSFPSCLIQATLATEDNRFYQHPGVDWIGILRALWINLRGGQTLAGGSTITQQVARNLLLDPQERYRHSLFRKLRESYLAWQLTRRYSKDDVLAFYLNQTYYGSLAYGVEAASQTYFGKPAAELDLAQCALLAGLPQAPALYSPFDNPDAAHRRQAIVLGLMEREGYITTEQRLQAEREPMVYVSTPYPMEAPHFVLMVRARLDGLLPTQDLLRYGGLTVRTTLDLDWQHLAEQFITRQIEELKNTPDGLGHNLNSAALVALDPRNGEILTLVGSPDYSDVANAGAINMVLAPRQPGSAIKPLVYAVALTPGQSQPWTAATSILDVRTSFLTRDDKAYLPSNYDGQEHGPVLAREALASSLNIPAVLTLQHVGMKSLFDFASQLGITTFGDPADYDLSLALGGGEVRLLELTAAYGAFANGGYRVVPNSILEIRDVQGNLVYSPPSPARQQVVDERVAWLISDILSDNQARTLGFGRNSVLRLDRTAAVKTGTTTNYHDNWTIGYTSELVVGVWAGNTDYKPMRNVSGVTGAAPIWHNFMRAVLTGHPEASFTRPPGLIQEEVCALSGLLPTPVCPYRHLEWFITGTQPKAYDHYFQEVTVDQATGLLADGNTPPERRLQRVALDLPPQAGTWARSQGLSLLSDLRSPIEQASGHAPNSQVSLRLVSPATGSVYHLDPDFAYQAQQIQVEAIGEDGLKNVTLWVDGTQLADFQASPYETWWPLAPGMHRAWAEALSNTGEKVTSQVVTFEVSAESP